MKEQLISFETAKLAKEKGYNEIAYNVYHGEGYLNEAEDNDFELFTNGSLYTVAPTQSLLQKWLREMHGIHILMSLAVPTLQHRSVIYQVKGGKVITVMDFTATDNENYEEVLEVGLQEALKLIQ